MQKSEKFMGFMKYSHYIYLVTIFLLLSTFWSGCTGGTFEYVETINKPSSELLSGRYVSHRRSIKVNVINRRLRLQFALPRKQARINKHRIEVTLKRFDFGEWVKNDRLAWFKYVALKSTPTCADNAVRFRADLPVLESNKTEPLDVEFAQNKEGLIKIQVRGQYRKKVPLVSLEVHLKQGTSHKHVTCVSQWRDENALGNIATNLMQLRNGVIESVRQPVGFDLKVIGTRLSRKQETPPPNKAPEVPEENLALEVSPKPPIPAITQPETQP
jgi:hypothetical protein